MSADTARTRFDTTAALLAWHAEEAAATLQEAVEAFFAMTDALTAGKAESYKQAVGAWCAPFLDKLQAAGDQFDCLYCLATGTAHPVPE